jgi:hypothetical protein
MEVKYKIQQSKIQNMNSNCDIQFQAQNNEKLYSSHFKHLPSILVTPI